jgi:multiple sugar transport system substrate-binding protein
MTDDADQSGGRDIGLTRRRVLYGSGLAMAGLAGCLGGDDSDEMTFLHFETDPGRRDTIGAIGDSWAEDSDFDFNQQDTPEEDLPADITASVSADTLPATAELPNGILFDARDAINEEPANNIIDEFGEDAFYDKTLEFVSDGEGNYLGVPLYTWTQLFGWDEEYRQENSLPKPNTWSNFKEFAEFTHDPDNNKFGCLVGHDSSPYTLQSFQPFALANDAHVFDEDGNIIFDDAEMVEALEFYASLAELTPPGQTNADSFGAWELNDEGERQTYVYTSNTISFYFETAFDAAFDQVEEGWDATLEMKRNDDDETGATYGEVVSTVTMDVDDDDLVDASEEFQKYLHNTEDNVVTPGTDAPDGLNSPYIEFCHLQPGLFNPTRPDVYNSDAFRDARIESDVDGDGEDETVNLFDRWPDEWLDELIPNAIANMERFGRRGDNVFPEIGDITAEFLITGAIQDILAGQDAETVANQAAEDMRDIVNDG